MENYSNVLQQIQQKIKDSSDAEARVAEVVLDNPHAVIDTSIALLAGQAQVSEPTVVRFCRSLGFEGFREFKLRLAQSLAAGVPYVHREVKPGDNAASYIHKIGQSAIELLSKLVTQLDSVEVEHAVATLASANRIEFWGFGASAAVAMDAHHKFFRLGIPCNFYFDPHMQCMSASNMGADDVIVAISHTGRTKELIENTRIARKGGVIVLGITASASPLAQECSQVLGVDIEEDTDVFPPMISRLAHLLLIDILVIGVALRRGQQVTERLQRMKKALGLKRLPGVGEGHVEAR